MLLVNNQTLPVNTTKDSEMYPYVVEYNEGIKKLKADYPDGKITLMRIGYPQMNPSGLPEEAPPIVMTMQKTVDGVTWAYCKGRPIIHPNGLRDLPLEDRAETLSGETLTLDLTNNPDRTFYIMYKSKLLGTEYRVFNPEGDRIKAAEEKNNRLKVQFAIREGMDDNKLRAVAATWGVVDAFKKNPLLIEEELEAIVFAADERKKKNPTELSLKGITDFLREIKSDEYLMPRALVQMAIDYGKLKWNAYENKFYFGTREVCSVPHTKIDDRVEFCANYLTHPSNKEKWDAFLVDVIDEEYIKGLNKYTLRWLASQVGIALNQKDEAIQQALLGKFRPQ